MINKRMIISSDQKSNSRFTSTSSFRLFLDLKILSCISLILISSSCFISPSYGQRLEPRVSLKSGHIIGIREIFDNKDVNVFLGIPYAEKPMDDLRFKKPLPPPLIPRSSFGDIRDEDKKKRIFRATQWPPVCPQSGIFHEGARGDFNTHRMSEDCLYLNVWSPVVDDVLTSGQNLLPVIFYIHGGGYSAGSASQDTYNSTALSVTGNVVVVTINYRLGALGLLYTACGTAPGNAGFYDQLLALEWVNDNIVYFGGDPARITLVGESAGSMYVGLHLLSGYSRYLFKNAIMMSGSPLSSAGMTSRKVGLIKSKNLAKIVGCPLATEEIPIDGDPLSGVSSTTTASPAVEVVPVTEKVDEDPVEEAKVEDVIINIAETQLNPGKKVKRKEKFTEETFKCLMDVDVKMILAAQNDKRIFDGLDEVDLPESDKRLLINEIPFLPIYGTEILPDDPIKVIREKSFSKNMSLLIGTVEDEGSIGLVVSGLLKNRKNYQQIKRSDVEDVVRMYSLAYRLKFSEPKDVVTNYFGVFGNSSELRNYHLIRAVSDAYGDSLIQCPTNYFAKEFSKGSCNTVHSYQVTYKSISPGIREKASWCSEDLMGVCHWTDLIYLFGLPIRSEYSHLFNDNDRKATYEMIKIWSDFARYGGKSPTLWSPHHVTSSERVIPFSYEINPLIHECSRLKRSVRYDSCDILWEQEISGLPLRKNVV